MIHFDFLLTIPRVTLFYLPLQYSMVHCIVRVMAVLFFVERLSCASDSETTLMFYVGIFLNDMETYLGVLNLSTSEES